MGKSHLSDEAKTINLDQRGRWVRDNKQTCLADLWRLDMVEFAQKIDLTRSCSGTWYWQWSNGQEASIGFHVQPEVGVRLQYTHNRTAKLDYLVPVTTTSPNYGGRRWWWLCPQCGLRCRVLYGGWYYVCQQCAGGYYPIKRSKDLTVRVDNELAKLKRKLGKYGSDRPKGMHWRTFERLQNRYFQLQDCRDLAFRIELTKLARASNLTLPGKLSIKEMTGLLKLWLKLKGPT